MTIEKLYQLFLQSSGICTDSRKLIKNQLFFALQGTTFDGNQYADQAIKSGATYAVIDNSDYKVSNRCVLVSNTLQTLQDLATYHRQQLGIPIIALTGSNGKTTTKELINEVLSTTFKTFATQGNYNNHIGVPLTLLAMNSETEIGIVEMGANHPGEIALLSEITLPDYGYITNIGKAHLEGFINLEGVLNGKTELYRHLQKHNKHIFLNADDLVLPERAGTKNVYTFSEKEGYNQQITIKSADPMVAVHFDDIIVKSQLIGAYNVTNIAAAITIGMYFKIPKETIALAISSYIPENNRSQLIERDRQLVIMDAYNANPSSMSAAITNFAQLKAATKTVFLGDMFEVGKESTKEHQKILDQLCDTDVDQIVVLGNHFANTTTTDHRVLQFNSVEQWIAHHSKSNPIEGTILIKGSRGMKLERLLDYI